MSAQLTLETVERASELYHKLVRSHATLVGPDGSRQRLPESLCDFLASLSLGVEAGQAVTIAHDDAQLTSVEAAKLLAVSRQHLIKLLELGEIPHHMVGTHRRIYARDLVAYKAQRDSRRRKILNDLTRAEAEDGLYDLAAPDDID